VCVLGSFRVCVLGSGCVPVVGTNSSGKCDRRGTLLQLSRVSRYGRPGWKVVQCRPHGIWLLYKGIGGADTEGMLARLHAVCSTFDVYNLYSFRESIQPFSLGNR
jgi:hypothetical protein